MNMNISVCVLASCALIFALIMNIAFVWIRFRHPFVGIQVWNVGI